MYTVCSNCLQSKFFLFPSIKLKTNVDKKKKYCFKAFRMMLMLNRFQTSISFVLRDASSVIFMHSSLIIFFFFNLLNNIILFIYFCIECFINFIDTKCEYVSMKKYLLQIAILTVVFFIVLMCHFGYCWVNAIYFVFFFIILHIHYV